MATGNREPATGRRKTTMLQALTTGAGVVVLLLSLASSDAVAQAVAGPERAKPVQGDPGISSMVVLNLPEFRVLRDYAEPGATRRMHSHDDATYHVFVLVTGRLRLTVEGEPPVEVNPGEALSLKGGARHTFVNIGDVPSTIVEVFGKGTPARGELAGWAALAQTLAATGARR
jgi:quercetin dioxygenase-like cupin family protein